MVKDPEDLHPIRADFRPIWPTVPPQLVRAWTNGEYRVGDRRSTDYEYIGTALALRGYYRYATTRRIDTGAKSADGTALQQTQLIHAGYCVIDFDETPDLYIAGVRVYTGQGQQPPFDKQQNWAHPIYWRSRFSKFRSEGQLPRVHFAYTAYKYTHKSGVDTQATYDIRDFRLYNPTTNQSVPQFEQLEQFWRPKREKLATACKRFQTDLGRSGGTPPEVPKFPEDIDREICIRLRDREQMASDFALLQHHHDPRDEMMLGVITIEPNVRDRSEASALFGKGYLAVVNQPLAQ